MAKDEIETTIALTTAIKDLSQANEGLIAGFGELSTNRIWTVISRFASGTGFWKLQNYVRAISTMTDLYNKRLAKNREEMVKGLESNLKLQKSYKALKEEMKGLEENPAGNKLYDMITSVGVEHKEALAAAEAYYKGTSDEMDKLFKKREKLLKKTISKKITGSFFAITDRFKEEKSAVKFLMKEIPLISKPFEAIGKTADKLVAMPSFKEMYGQSKDLLLGKEGSFLADNPYLTKKPGNLDPKQRRGFKSQASKFASKMSERFDNLFIDTKDRKSVLSQKIEKFWPKIKMFFTITTAVVGKVIMYFAIFLVGLTLVIGIIKKIWPFLRDSFTKNTKFFEKSWGYLRAILYDFYQIFKAVWEGDFLKVLDIYFTELLPNIFMFLGNLLWGLGKVLINLVKTGFNAVIDYITSKMGKGIPFIPGIHTGGLIKKGGVAVVGERGPELVNLPTGARVHSNAQSQAMMGHTINIHVNGRVGATDAEIKDIANKLSAEMNRRINRTNRSVNAF